MDLRSLVLSTFTSRSFVKGEPLITQVNLPVSFVFLCFASSNHVEMVFLSVIVWASVMRRREYASAPFSFGRAFIKASFVVLFILILRGRMLLDVFFPSRVYEAGQRIKITH